MSPLVSSLFALAALLAAAAADAADDTNCVTLRIGRKTIYFRELSHVDLQHGVGELRIKDVCKPLEHVGGKIMVCNKAVGNAIPEATERYDQLATMDVNCHDPDGCTAYATEYCG